MCTPQFHSNPFIDDVSPCYHWHANFLATMAILDVLGMQLNDILYNWNSVAMHNTHTQRMPEQIKHVAPALLYLFSNLPLTLYTFLSLSLSLYISFSLSLCCCLLLQLSCVHMCAIIVKQFYGVAIIILLLSSKTFVMHAMPGIIIVVVVVDVVVVAAAAVYKWLNVANIGKLAMRLRTSVLSDVLCVLCPY